MSQIGNLIRKLFRKKTLEEKLMSRISVKREVYNQQLIIVVYVDRDKFQQHQFCYIPTKEEADAVVNENVQKALNYLKIHGV